ncbi:MAG: substrate-binding periplasmic protein [Thalassotalea sp.]
MIVRNLFLTLFITLLACSAMAKDIVRLNKGRSDKDVRTQYKMDVLQNILEITREEYGDFEIVVAGPYTTLKRAIIEVNSGETINVFMAITTPVWEQNTIPIRIPVRRGILNYRLLSIHKDKLKDFEKVDNIHDLKHLLGGLRIGWATSKIMKDQKFNIFEANTIDGLYHMLQNKRIDYIPRGSNEIYSEISSRKPTNPDIVIEPTLALYLPAPYYIFVSPKEVTLAKRITAGLKMMVDDGSLERLFYQYHRENIITSKLHQRKIIRIGNPSLPVETPLKEEKYWFENDLQFKQLKANN